MTAYEVGLVIVGIALVGAVVLPRLLDHRPLSFPVIYVGGGIVLFTVLPGAPALDPVVNAYRTERLTELVVIISLMGAGLKIDRPFAVETWTATWRLLGITFPLTAGSMALLAWGVLGLHPATAILLGAVVAPTDPVLASGVEAGPPMTDVDGDNASTDGWGTVRFALTSEAGFNDGLAFPVTNLAIAVAGATLTESYRAPVTDGYQWLWEWVLIDGLYKITAGIVMGYLIGYVMARFLFRSPTHAPVADVLTHGDEVMAGAEALATTLVAYGVTELVAGYGFIAVFVASLTLRGFEWDHDYYQDLHDFAVLVERLLLAAVLVLFGGAIAGGLLAPLTWLEAGVGLLLVGVIRPVAGLLGFVGTSAAWPDRAAISFFGIRGVGSFYYLSHALAEASFQELELVVAAEQLWAFVGFVVLASILVHGVSASPVMDTLDWWHERASEEPASAET